MGRDQTQLDDVPLLHVRFNLGYPAILNYCYRHSGL